METPSAPTIRVAQRVRRTASEGPGERYALWVQGCSIRCAGCCNPDMFTTAGGTVLSVAELAQEIEETRDIEGITFLGGEPFEQAGPLAMLAERARVLGLSVMTFTGNVLEDLTARAEPDHLALLAETDLLADGPFVASRPGSRYRWLGSENQRLLPLTSRYRADDPRFFEANTVDIRIAKGSIEISGWAPAAIQIGSKPARNAK